MGQEIIYALPGSFNKTLAIMTCREHLCGYYQTLVTCTDAETYVDPATGHVVCSGCQRITVDSGLRVCDICDTEYIDKTRVHPKSQDTNCPKCIEEYGIEE